MNHSQRALLRLQLTPNLGRSSLFKLHRCFGDFTAAVNASVTAWKASGVAVPLQEHIPRESDSQVKKTLERLISLDVRLISFWDPGYPPLLREIHDPPALVYVRGELPRQECFAIVGSRRATAQGLIITQQLAATLAQQDICIVSGLARGIDAAAHRGALEAQGTTIAVLGCGIDRIYPPENSRLFHDILKSGAILSEYPPGAPPLAGHFPGRNRIISGLSRGVLIVEAAEKSGSLITGDFALEQGRELFAVPGGLNYVNSRGTNRLLKDGAQLVTEAEDILQALWPDRQSKVARQTQDAFVSSLSPAARAVYLCLGFEPLHIDNIARTCCLTPMELSAILLDLELQGGVQALPGNLYIRSRS
ncbi:MAG: DNA-processing protein DprA [Desulfuromonadales bacterium]|nr:DNA-processing protein DprA [Desulfuromonadales bacterium]MBN2791786.1 DNA-processing protein DprA [Desulfuromonadales bacterium]